MFYANNTKADSDNSGKYEISKNAYYNYMIFRCYEQVRVFNDLDRIQVQHIPINQVQWLKTGKSNKDKQMRDYDSHPQVELLKERYAKVVMIHNCELIDEKERKKFNTK